MEGQTTGGLNKRRRHREERDACISIVDIDEWRTFFVHGSEGREIETEATGRAIIK
jgi:hypothetical protein